MKITIADTEVFMALTNLGRVDLYIRPDDLPIYLSPYEARILADILSEMADELERRYD